MKIHNIINNNIAFDLFIKYRRSYMKIIQSAYEIELIEAICGCDSAGCSCDSDTLLPEDEIDH